jgi:hypothetical protein
MDPLTFASIFNGARMPLFSHQTMTNRMLRIVLALTVFLGPCGFAMAQLSAARVMSVTGSAKAIDPQGQERLLEKGGEIRSGDKIVTADGALVQLKLNDGGFMSVRSGTEMVIDRFVYDEKAPANSNFLVSLVRGGFRSITGLIGRTNPNAYQIRAGTATVGIRGTDHEPMVIPEGLPAAPALLGAPGLYDKVNEGETFIRNGRGELALKRGQIGFTPTNTDRPPLMLQKIPEFYRVDVKVDARESNDGADSKQDGANRMGNKDGLLRPSAAARGAALKSLAIGNELESARITGDKVLTPLAPATIAPSTTLIAPSTSYIAPTTTLLAPTTTLIAPTTTLIAPVTTYIAPTTTLIAPTTTYIAPVTTYIAPTTTLIAPTTTYIAPKTTINSTILLK